MHSLNDYRVFYYNYLLHIGTILHYRLALWIRKRFRSTCGDGFNHEMVDLKEIKPYPTHLPSESFLFGAIKL